MQRFVLRVLISWWILFTIAELGFDYWMDQQEQQRKVVRVK